MQNAAMKWSLKQAANHLFQKYIHTSIKIIYTRLVVDMQHY